MTPINAHTVLKDQCAACAPGHRDKKDAYMLFTARLQTHNNTFSVSVVKLLNKKAQMQTFQFYMHICIFAIWFLRLWRTALKQHFC